MIQRKKQVLELVQKLIFLSKENRKKLLIALEAASDFQAADLYTLLKPFEIEQSEFLEAFFAQYPEFAHKGELLLQDIAVHATPSTPFAAQFEKLSKINSII